ncbi:MAG TPA: rhodanese-like domain-containing protein [Lachnoclostridium sp.]|uniref:rhodanese-like domain-containing protein n=1 Tax=Lacrimispora sp. TaxID=2719234 RepID=UPI000EE1F02E|nr:rhodanese-like domain-containing protein [Lacrimispora sp.]HCD43093.1 rhodanese-like domain-containing protein [Lachnoclostridium sp.]
MSIFNFFSNRSDFASGIEQANNTSNAVLLDVRTVQEYANGHVPGSVNLPLDRLDSNKLDKNNPVFVYCRSGARSRQACRFLRTNGYSVTDIGGIADYRGKLEKGI